MPHPVEALIRDVPDFPKPGILFKDLTPLFRDANALRVAMTDLSRLVDFGRVDVIAGVEARGFVLAGYVAALQGKGLVPVRKAGKLPWKVVSETYALEYGTDTLEIHADACAGGARVLLLDDVLATGGTAAAARRLVEKAGGTVMGVAFLLELDFLNGRRQLPGVDIHSLIHVSG